MNAGDWINAVNAFGTTAAVAVALWLGLQARGRQRSEEKARASLFAARVSARLASTAERLRLHTLLLGFNDETFSKEDGTRQALVDIARMVRKGVYFPDDAALIALTPLPNNCAHRIARAADYVDRVRAQVPDLPTALMTFGDADTERKLLKNWIADLEAAAALLAVAAGECVRASDLGAPMPSAEEIYGPQDE